MQCITEQEILTHKLFHSTESRDTQTYGKSNVTTVLLRQLFKSYVPQHNSQTNLGTHNSIKTPYIQAS
jgi:hypothetical protein